MTLFERAPPTYLEVLYMQSAIPSLSLLGTLASLFALACSSTPGGTPDGGDSGAAGETGCVQYAPSPSSLMTPTVSFVGDVMPIFVHSCAFSGCHINPPLMDGGPPSGNLEFLFVQDHTAPIAMYARQVYDGIVSKPTIEVPTLNFVTPGDPANSFLMRKMDFALCDIPTQCAASNPLFQKYNGPDQAYPAPNGCGVGMPPDLYDDAGAMQPLVDSVGMPTQRETVKRWIAQGAMFN